MLVRSGCSSSSDAKSISIRPPLPLRTMRDAGAEREAQLALRRRACGRPSRGVVLRRRRAASAFLTSASVSRTERLFATTSRDDAQLRGFVGQRRAARARGPSTARPSRRCARTSCGQLQQPDVVGDRRAVLADGVGDLLLRQVELVGEPPVGERLFDRVEVLALDVLDERDREQPARRARRARRPAPCRRPARCAARQRRSPATIS